MAKASAAVAEKPKVTVKGETKTLPEEQFWQRYSPHFEFPLSHAAAWVVHVIAGVFLILIAVGWSLGWWADDTTPDMDAIALMPGGGGGNPNGVGSGPGVGDPPPPPENVPDKQPTDPTKVVPPVALPELPAGPVDPIALPTFKDETGQRVIDIGNQAVAAMAKINETARTKMFNGLAGKGQGGAGSGGGTGTGDGTGTGPGTGEGKGKLSERQKRLLRWAMIFNTRDGSDYVRQLGQLGAMIGIPEANGDYRIYEDLRKRPAQGVIKDLAEIKNIYWIDEKPESVKGICRALNIPSPPEPQVHFVAFFPIKLEGELAEMEIQHMKRNYPGKNLEDVDETRFEVKNNQPVITGMTLKGGR